MSEPEPTEDLPYTPADVNAPPPEPEPPPQGWDEYLDVPVPE